MSQLFLSRLQDHSRAYADKAAIWLGAPPAGRAISYAELEATVRATMAYLRGLGLGPGDRLAIQLPKGLPFVCLHLAAMRLGAISLPLNPAYPPEELAYFLADSAAGLLFADAADAAQLAAIGPGLPELRATVLLDSADPGQFAALIAAADPAGLPEPPADGHATALMIYTSGTTGRPKGAEISHANLTANLESLRRAWGWRDDDVLLHVLPIFHIHGLVVALHGALHAAATSILLPRFSPDEALRLLAELPCTVFMGVPTIHRRLVDASGAAGYDLRRMRLITSGSDRLPDELFAQFQATFGHTLLERYGMSETGMNISNPLAGERRVGSVGIPLPGVEVRVADPATDAPLPDNAVGEVQVRGPNVFKGYWRMPAKTAEAFTADGWLRTGDLGLREPDGYFTLKGRSKDLIITGGLNVYPPEVELALAELPELEACAVIGCPDSEWGERIVAVVVLRAGARLSAEAIVAHCRQKLAPYKAPRQVLFAADLPRNALGKVQKAQLRAELCDAC